MNEDVKRKIDLANEALDDSFNTQEYDVEHRQLFATQALAQAQLATAYAVMEQAFQQTELLAQLRRWDGQGFLDVRVTND